MQPRLQHAFALALLLGCSGKPKEPPPPPPPELGAVLPRLPLPPDAQPLTTQTGADAMQLILVSPHAVDTVAAYYRQVLGEPPFHLVSETPRDGVIAFYAAQDGPSIWVTVQKNGETGAMVIIAGAGTDSSSVIKKGIVPKTSAQKP